MPLEVYLGLIGLLFMFYLIRLFDGPKRWTWNGDVEAPTLDPSLQLQTKFYDGTIQINWHGYLKAGRFVPCADPPSQWGT